MDTVTFRKNLAKDIELIRQKHKRYSNDGQAFTHWALENVFLLADKDALESNRDATNDRGLDSFIIDEHDNSIRLIQCKYSEEVSRDENENIILLPNKLSDPKKAAQLWPSISDASELFREYFDYNFDVYIYIVFIGESRHEVVQSLKQQLDNSVAKDIQHRYSVEVIGIQELIRRYLAKSPYDLLVPKKKTLELKNGEFLTYKNDSIDGIVAVVNGNELATFADSPAMFLANFRFFLDLRNRVNSTIQKTIQNESENELFWSYNNGVTIVCDSFTPPAEGADTKLVLMRPQIVNGCQTVSIFNRGDVRPFTKDIDVLVRIIATRDEEVKKKVATFTNTQTKVSDRTLRSNDQIQRSLQYQFKSLDPSYFYDCKDGEWNALPKDQKAVFSKTDRGDNRIINTECAKSFIAFHGKPTDAKSSPRLVWDLGPTGVYGEVFPLDRKAEELLLPYLLMKEFNDKIEQVLKNLEKEDTEESRLRESYLSHCDTTMLAVAGFIIAEYLDNDFTIDKLETLILTIDNFSSKLFEVCEYAINYEFGRSVDEANEKGQIFNPRIYFLRNETFKILKRKINESKNLLGVSAFYEKCGFMQF